MVFWSRRFSGYDPWSRRFGGGTRDHRLKCRLQDIETTVAQYWHPQGSNNSTVQIYQESYYRGREGWLDFRMEVRSILHLARLEPGSRVLEIGCGSGELLRALAPAAHLVVGVDLTMSGLILATRRGRVACARGEELPFGNGVFDTVVAQHLIEHLPDPAAALAEWRRVLRPDGRVVVVSPNAAYPDPAHFEDPTHVHIFTPADLRGELERAGYRVDALFTLFPYLGSGRLARSASIRLASLARRLPSLAQKGRSIVAAARL